MIQPETRYTTVGNDRVAYQVLGEGPRDLVLTTAQWSNIDRFWEEPAVARFLRRLAMFSRVIVFDPRGAGQSDARPKDGRQVWEHWAEDLLIVMRANHSNAVTLAGLADGGPAAIRFSADFPERCSGLVLINTFARLTVAADYREGQPSEEIDKYLGFAIKYWGTDRFLLWLNPSIAENESARCWAHKLLRGMGAPKDMAEMFRIQVAWDVRDALPRIRAPTLMMARGNIKGLPIPLSRYVAEHIPSAQFIELPGADYWPYWETPDLILDHIEEFLTGKRHGGEPDRILTTLLFTDIVGSTGRAAKLGDAAWRALLDRHDQTLREQVGLFGGHVADHSGDGSLSTFENPRRAIDCSLALQKALAEIGVEIRAGVHFGEAEKRADGGVGGVNVHVGARVMALANAGEVLASHTVQGILVGSRYSFEERGIHELKGVPGKWPVYAVGAGKQS